MDGKDFCQMMLDEQVLTRREGCSRQGAQLPVQRCGGHTGRVLFKVLQTVHVRSRN